MRRVTAPFRIVAFVFAIGLAAAVGWMIWGGGGGQAHGHDDVESIDTGDAVLRGAGLLEEGRGAPLSKTGPDVVRAAPTVSTEPAGAHEIVGQVVGPDGHPVVSTVVFFPDQRVRYGTATTDASGRFRIRTSRADDAQETVVTGIVALFRPLGRTASLVRARSGDGALRVVASLVSKARITVLDEAGKPVGNAHVRTGILLPRWGSPDPSLERVELLHASFFARAGTYTDRSGVATVQQAPIPTRFLSAEAPLDRDLSPATLAGWDGGDATIRMAATPRVEGEVRERDGAPLPDGMVWWRRSGTEDWKSVRIQYDGTFSIDCGEPGAIELCPRMFNSFPQPPIASRVVPSGASNVVLSAEAGPTLDLRIETGEDYDGFAQLFREPADEKGARRLTFAFADGRVQIRGLDAKARYTLWIPPFLPGAREPAMCALRTGLTATDEPRRVELTKVEHVRVTWSAPVPPKRWYAVKVMAHGMGMRLDLHSTWAGGDLEGDELAPRVSLPPGKFSLRVEADLRTSTDEQLDRRQLLVLPYAGEMSWEPGTEEVVIPLSPTATEPAPFEWPHSDPTDDD